MNMPGLRWGASMQGFDQDRLFSALMYLAMALFVAGGLSWSRGGWLRRAAIAVYAVVVVLVLIDIAIWLVGSQG